jgi:hypothetical protein
VQSEGTFSRVIGIALRESRLYGSDVEEVARTIIAAIRLRLTESVADSQTSLPQRLIALRPTKGMLNGS